VAALRKVETDLTTSGLIEVRRSGVHGLGVFATQRIRKGTRIIEYVGERVSHDEADRRYEEKDANDSHTFLFIVDSKTVIDAGVDGNDARFFNHSCNPNCESTVEKKRVYIEAIRDVEAGGELTYDYQIYREDDDPDNIDEIFACRCGFAKCRGTMLWPTERKKPKRTAAKKKARAKAKSSARTQTDAPSKSTARTRTDAPSKSTARTRTDAPSKSTARKKSGAGSKSRAKTQAGTRNSTHRKKNNHAKKKAARKK
jgi:hypothetical protein